MRQINGEREIYLIWRVPPPEVPLACRNQSTVVVAMPISRYQ
jgi:hypothetical protein